MPPELQAPTRTVAHGIAALRGAVLGALWAAALLTFLSAVGTTSLARGPLVAAYSLFAGEWWLGGAGPLRVISSSVVAAALVGAGIGLLAPRVAGLRLRRAVLLALTAAGPGLYLVVLVAFNAILPVPEHGGLLEFLGRTTGSAAYGMLVVLPVAAIPAVAYGATLERATRNEATPAGPLGPSRRPSGKPMGKGQTLGKRLLRLRGCGSRASSSSAWAARSSGPWS